MSTATTDRSLLAPGAGPVATSLVILKRALTLLPRTPAAWIPNIMFPLMITVALSGSQSGVAQLPDYPVAQQIDWVMPFALVQAGALAGMGVGFALIRDLEGGFFDRFRAAPISRVSIIVGFMVSAFFRAMLPLLIVGGVGFLDGARIRGGVLGVLCLVAANQGAAVIGGAWGVGMALRFRSMRAAPLMFLPVFVLVFLSTAQVPFEYLTGWLRPVARWNPVTQVLDLARAGFREELLWGEVWPGLSVVVASVALVSWFALRGLRRVEN